MKKNDNIFIDDVNPATPLDELEIDRRTIDTSEAFDTGEEAQG